MYKNRAISLFMAFVLLVGNLVGFITPTSVYAATPTQQPLGDVQLKSIKDGESLMDNKWGTILPHTVDFVVYEKDGKNWPAYCIDPLKPGVQGSVNYSVTASTLLENPKVYGAIVNGYPFKTASELGLTGTNADYKAYYATKMAIWTLLGTENFEFSNMKGNGSANDDVYGAYKIIYEASKDNINTGSESLTGTSAGVPLKINGDLIQTFSVTPTVGQYTVSIVDNAPIGTQITDMNGQMKTTFQGNEQFKVKIPEASISTSGSFNLKITTPSGNGTAMVYHGVPADLGKQSYAVVYENELEGNVTVKYDKEIEVAGSGKLKVVKKAAGTETPLAGAEISLTKIDGKDASALGTKWTDANGEASWDNLPLGTYKVSEKTPPKGYVLDIINSKDITLIADKPQHTVTFENEKTPKLEVYKKDAKTGQPVPGTVFEVSLDGGTEKYTITTDSTGMAKIGQSNVLKPGTYKIKEVLVPEPYYLDPKSSEQYIKLEPGKTSSATFKNYKKEGIGIEKRNLKTGQYLSGAQFVVKGVNNDFYWEGTVENGQRFLEGLRPGTYEIYEMEAPYGFIKSAEKKVVNLELGETVMVKFDNVPLPELEVLKTDDEGNPVAKAKFEIKKADGQTVFTKWTDEKGRIYIPYNDPDIRLEEAVYTVKEVEAPKGYVADEKCIQNIALEWGQKKTLTFVNHKKPTLTILKIDEETKLPLEGAKFRIVKTEDETIKEALSNKEGKIILEDLEPGIYSVDEIVAPSGYLLEAQHKDIELKPGDQKELIFTNKAKPKLRIQKVDANTGELLKNAEFRVTKVEDKTVSEYILENGEIILSNLDEAIYRAEEFMAPEGYIALTTAKEIMTEWGKTKTLKFDNVRKPVVIFKKTNGLTGKAVPGATFKVEYELSNGGVKSLGNKTTDANGLITIPKADPGYYIFTEVMAAPGYSKNTTPIRQYFAPGDNAYLPSTNQYYANSGTGKYASGTTPNDGTTESQEKVDTTENNATNNINNSNTTPTEATSQVSVHSGSEYYVEGQGFNWPLNSIVLKKADANTGELLEGAVFELYRADEQVSGQPGTQIGRYTTDHSGVVVIIGLDPGYYVAKEVKAPTNYILAETSLQNGFLKPDGTSVLEMTFNNFPYGSILITKVDALTGKPLPNAKFKVTDSAGAIIGNSNGEFTTNSNGEALVGKIPPGSYIISELQAPEHYAINTTPKTVQIGTDGKTYTVGFENYPYGALVIKKLDSDTKEPLPNAEFKITTAKGDVVGTGNGYFKTDETGTILIENLPKGSYVLQETKAPANYILENETKTIDIDYGKTYTLEFFNKKMSSLQIVKVDAQTKQPLKDAQFKIYKANGELINTYTTDGHGLIVVPFLQPGWYKALESKAPTGYLIDETPKDFEITGNQFVKLVFENEPMASLVIKKVDDKTGAPLSGAVFQVERQNGEHVGEYSTDQDGTINIPTLSPDWYVIREKKSPDGYLLDESPKTIEVKTKIPTVVTFTNMKKASLEIKKVDEKSGKGLPGAVFTVSKQNGEKVYTNENGTEFVTDSQGFINIPSLNPGFYTITEVKAPDGYFLENTPKTVEVKTDSVTSVTFTNKYKSGLQIIKEDAETGVPLPNAKFTIYKKSGEVLGEFVTDKNGVIIVDQLENGWYKIAESKAPEGYQIDELPKDIEVTGNEFHRIVFTNKKLAGLTILKLNSETKAPIEGVEFTIAQMNGKKVLNDTMGETFKTDSTGRITIPNLANGYYLVTETKAKDGYFLDAEPKKVLVEAGKSTVLEVLNEPASGLLIVKTDKQTGKPLQGVVFDVRRADGQRVQGSILDQNQPNTPNNSPNKSITANGDVSGSYTTDANGRILINHLAPGEYHVVETKALSGYVLDTEVYSVTITPGKQAVLKVQNTPLAGLRLKKIDAVTGAPIYGTEFMIFDQNNKVLGTFYTDNNGIIDFSAILTEGKYTIRETRAAEGYYRDDQPRTVEFVAGKVTQIVWKNQPNMAQIQITKLSEDDNEVTGLPAGTPLEGAIFEVVAYKSGNVVDRFVTTANGRGVSKPLPLGRYLVREVQAPPYYQLNSKELDVTLEFATQIIKLEFTNKSANTGVSIKKVGNLEAMPGDLIRYDIKTVKNTSTVPLTDFFWRDVLPVDAVRLNKIITGTYNQSLKYKIMVTTNKGNTKVIADNLSTTQNNVVDCSPQSLGLASNEFVTSFTLVFGNVKAGFTCVEQPQIFVDVLKTLPNGFKFSNKADVGGKYQNEWIISSSTWLSTVYRNVENRLPKTGY